MKKEKRDEALEKRMHMFDRWEDTMLVKGYSGSAVTEVFEVGAADAAGA